MSDSPSFASVSVVVPVFKNARTLEDLTERLCNSLKNAAESFEVIFVNDASPDNSRTILEDLVARCPPLSVIDLRQNVGQQHAVRIGLEAAGGDAVIVLDADLQDPPEAIIPLVEHLRSGPFDAVFAARSGIYQSVFRMLCSWVFRWLVRLITGLPKGAGGYVAMTRRMVSSVIATKNRRFYLAGLIGCSGYPISAIPVKRDLRTSDQSAYSGSMRLSVALSDLSCVLAERVRSWP